MLYYNAGEVHKEECIEGPNCQDTNQEGNMFLPFLAVNQNELE